MSSTRHHFKEFAGHTRLKHWILRAYLGAWAAKLIQAGPEREVVFVDAFAGEGKDGKGQKGSPLIAANIARSVTAKLRTKHPGAKFTIIAIEKSRRRLGKLRSHVENLPEEERRLIEVLPGELTDHIDAIVQRFGAVPKLFFLDPFGIEGLHASMYPRALRGPRDEIFSLFSDMGAGRLFGTVIADGASLRRKIEELRAMPTLFPEEDANRQRAAEKEYDTYLSHLELTRQGSVTHLANALGSGEWLPMLQATPKDRRPQTFLGLFLDRLYRDGAQRVLPMPMRKETGERVYSLVHATKSAAGFMTMKEAIASSLNKEEFLSADVRGAIRQDLSQPVIPIVEHCCRAFAGQTVRWSKEKGLREWVLANTPIFPFQTDELLDELRKRAEVTARPFYCRFPLIPPSSSGTG